MWKIWEIELCNLGDLRVGYIGLGKGSYAKVRVFVVYHCCQEQRDFVLVTRVGS